MRVIQSLRCAGGYSVEISSYQLRVRSRSLLKGKVKLDSQHARFKILTTQKLISKYFSFLELFIYKDGGQVNK